MKFDTSKIENFDTLSAEDKLKAILEFEMDDDSKLKDALNKASSEAANYKKQLREKQSEAERLEAERKEADLQKDELLKSLMREKTVSEHKANFLSVGYDNELASKSAEALADGNFAEIFNGFKSFVENRDKSIRAELLKSTPSPVGGSTDKGTISKEQFAKMNYSERAKFYAENPELYKEYTK